MRWVIVLGLLLIVGCNAVLTEEQARSACAAVGTTGESVDDVLALAREDEEKGLSAAESMDLFLGDCEESCGTDATCISDCTACTDAVVIYVYSD